MARKTIIWKASNPTVTVSYTNTLDKQRRVYKSKTYSGKAIPKNATRISASISGTVRTSGSATGATKSAQKPKAGSEASRGIFSFSLPKSSDGSSVTGSATWTGTKMVIHYTVPGGSSGSGKKSGSDDDDDDDDEKLDQVDDSDRLPGLFPNMEQVAYIIDTVQLEDETTKEKKEKKNGLYFDGVIKVSVNSTVKMDEDPKNHKGYDFKNNAQDQPDEIQLQVLESEVYTNTSNFEGDGSMSRTKSTYSYLYQLKEARRKVTLVIPHFGVFPDMVLKSLSATLDENTTNGWSGSLSFRQYMVIKKKSKKSNGDSDVGQGNDRQSVLYKMFGRIC